MSCTVRLLPFEEWDRLDTFPIMANGYPDPNTTAIMVAEDEAGEIVGTWCAITPIILEGLWVREDHRKGLTAGRLLYGMKAFLKDLNMISAYTLVQTPEVLALAEKAGFERIPGDFLKLELA